MVMHVDSCLMTDSSKISLYVWNKTLAVIVFKRVGNVVGKTNDSTCKLVISLLFQYYNCWKQNLVCLLFIFLAKGERL